jgi:thimet oligopeptidase
MTLHAPASSFDFNPAISLPEYEQLWRKQLQVLSDSFEALKVSRTKDNISTYLEELNAFEILMKRGDIWGHVWKSYQPDPVFRKEAEDAEVARGTMKAKVMASSEIAYNLAKFESTVALHDADSQRFLRMWKRDMRKAGAFLNMDAKAAVQRLTIEIEAESRIFLRNIRDDHRYLDMTPEDLRGLPNDFLASHPPNPETGLIRITSNRVDTRPILDFCVSQEARKKVYYLAHGKASPQNEAVLKRLLDLRYQKAALLGFSSWAEYQLEDNMMKTPEAASTFLQTAFESLKQSSDREKTEIAHLLKSNGHGDLNPWDLRFGVGLLKKKRMEGFEVKATRQYFPVRRVLPALQGKVPALFSLRLEGSITNRRVASIRHELSRL